MNRVQPRQRWLGLLAAALLLQPLLAVAQRPATRVEASPVILAPMEYYLALRMRRLSVRQTGRYAPARPVAAVRSVPRSDEPKKKH